MSGQHLIGDNAQRVEVAPGIDLLAGGLLRTHVHRRSHRHALSGARSARFGRDSPGDAKIRQEGTSADLVEQHVFRLHVPVHHARPSRGIEGRGHIGHDAGRILDRNSPLTREPLAQAFAGDLVHHVVQQPVRAPRRMDSHDVGVAQASNGSGFTQEAAGDGFVRGQFRVDNFDGNPAVQGSVGRLEYHTHAAASELALKPVLRSQRCLQGGEQIEGGIAHVRTSEGD